MSDLDAIGCRHGTEKASNTPGRLHNYLPFYEQFLAPLRDKEIVLLEVGVDRGNSLRMWKEYFQRGHVVGMDCQNLTHLREDRIDIEIGDQTVAADLDRISAKYGPFDVIVDDAGHIPSAQVFCFEHMINKLKPGGFYILEDLVGHNSEPLTPQCVDFLRDLAYTVVRRRMDVVESIAFSYGTSVTRTRQ